MKNILMLSFAISLTACQLRPDNNATNTAAKHFARVFITQHISSSPTLRLKTFTIANDTSNIYHISGLLEGYTSFNTPESVEHYSETLRYLGGNPNDSTSWECMEIYVGDKKWK